MLALTTAIALSYPSVDPPMYLMAFHHNGSTWLDSDGMHLAYSEDGLSWSTLAGPESCGDMKSDELYGTSFGQGLFIAPQVGRCRMLDGMETRVTGEGLETLQQSRQCPAHQGHMMRDPFVLWHPPSERYHAIWTAGWAASTIGHSSSTDLVTWSEQTELKVTDGIEEAINAWAPEALYDPKTKRTIVSAEWPAHAHRPHPTSTRAHGMRPSRTAVTPRCHQVARGCEHVCPLPRRLV